MRLDEVGERIVLPTPVRTVKQAAQAVGVSEDKIVKTLVVKCGEEYRAYILRGTKRLDLDKLGCRMRRTTECLVGEGACSYPTWK